MVYSDYIGTVASIAYFVYISTIYAISINHTTEIIVPNNFNDWLSFLLTLLFLSVGLIAYKLLSRANNTHNEIKDMADLVVYLFMIAILEFALFNFLTFEYQFMNFIVLGIFTLSLYINKKLIRSPGYVEILGDEATYQQISELFKPKEEFTFGLKSE